MKKTISMAMAFALAATLSTAAFAAATVEEDGGSENISVNAKYVDGLITGTTINADVVWGEMEFTYSVSGTKTWNTDKHEYDIVSNGAWSASGNEISVTNHSNAPISVDFSYEQLDDFKSVTGTFSKDAFSLSSAEGKAVDDERLTDSTTLTLGGELSSDVTEMTKVGTAKVTIEEIVRR